MPEVQHAITNGHCFLQLGSGGTVSPPVVPGQSPDGGPRTKPPEALEILQLTCAKNAKNIPSWSIYPKLQFHEYC